MFCETKTKESTSKVKRPRGDSSLGGKRKWSKENVTSQPNEAQAAEDKHDISTLQKLLKTHPEVFKCGSEFVDGYFERNTVPEIQKACALKVFNTAVNVWGDGIVEASRKASDVSGFHCNTIRKWASDYYLSLIGTDPDNVDDDTVELVLGSVRGKFSKRPHSLIKNDEFCQIARKFVRENACVRGEPNLTAEMFRRWIKTEHNCDISSETARKWLHTLGFKQVNHTKGVYFDGHEREDVVMCRKTFVEKLSDLDRRCMYSGHEPILHPNEKPLIIVHHDESTFYANADQNSYWADDSLTILKQKSLGQSIMVSDFIEEYSNDYLEYNGEQARLLLETQSDGYFDSPKFLRQVSK